MQSKSQFEVSTVQDLLNQGKSVKEIAEAFQTNLIKTKQFIRDNNLIDLLQNKSYWPWDEQEDDQLRDELERALPLEQIAELHSRTEGAVKCRIRNLKLEAASPEDPEDPDAPKKVPFRWSEESVEEMLRMKREGASLAAISQAIGRTEKAIQAKLRKIKAASKTSPLTPSAPSIARSSRPQGAEGFVCPCSKDRIRIVFGCGHCSCSECARKFRVCPTCDVEIHLRLELAF